MSHARKLPSGSWNCKVYSHTEKIKLPDGTTKDKRIYKSFTCDIPGPQGKRTCEKMAAEWANQKEEEIKMQKQNISDMTLTEAIDKYILAREQLGRSPSTVQGYRIMQKNSFRGLMTMKVSNITDKDLQNAIQEECCRVTRRNTRVSPKRIKNEWGLLASVLHKYGNRNINFDAIELPQVQPRQVELPSAQMVFDIVKGTEIELPVLLAMWLSFSMSEIRGLTKSKSISGDYITINEVVVDVDCRPVRKSMGKNPIRNRRHRIPPYIKALIDNVEGDVIVPMSGHAIYNRWIRLQKKAGITNPITFHDLRHVSASVMALLRIPDKYAQERGGWKTDQVMKQVYTQTFAEERVKVDDRIDKYFLDIMQHEMQHEKEKSP